MGKLLRIYRDTAVIFFNTMALIIIGHFMLGVAIYIKNYKAKQEISIPVPPIDTPIYESFPDKKTLWADLNSLYSQGMRYVPYYHWRRKPFQSKYVNVNSNGVRRTIKNPKPDAKKVFVFGGSTTWGSGVPDSHTIPSLLQKRFGNEYNFYNFGETGYVSAQEINYLLEKLANNEIPDIVIFYDGINDGYHGVYSPGIPRDPAHIRQQSIEWDKWRESKQKTALQNIYYATMA